MFELNLVPDIKREFLRKRKVRTIVTFACIIVAAAAIVVTALLGITVGTQAVTAGVVDGNIDSNYTAMLRAVGSSGDITLNRSDTEQILTLQRQLQGLASQAATKTDPSRIFAILDTILPPNFKIDISEIRYDAELATLAIDGQAGTYDQEGREQNGSQALAGFEETIKRTNYRFCSFDCENMSSWTEQDKQDNMTALTPLIVQDSISHSDVSYGRSFDGSLMLRFTVTFVLDAGVLDFNNKGMEIVAPTKQNVTDSYVQIRDDIFAERAQDDTSENAGGAADSAAGGQ